MAAGSTRLSLDELSPIIDQASKQFGVPTDLIWGVIRAENSGSPRGAAALKDVSTAAVSPKNARGVMQVTPVALQDVTQAGLIPAGLDHQNLSVEDQIGVGTAYLSRLMKLSQKPEEIYAMYNYGPKARFRMDQLPEETRGYLEKTGSTVKSGGGTTGTFGGGSMSGSDLVSQLIGITNQQNASMQSGLDSAQQLLSQATGLKLESNFGQQAAVVSAAATAAKQAEVTYQQNKTLENIQSMFRMDPNAANNEISKNLAAVDATEAAYAPLRAEYDQLSSVNLLENPLGYIMAQIKLPSVSAKVNAVADAQDRAYSNIALRTQQMAAVKASTTANTADQIKEIQLAQARQAADLATAKLDQEAAQNLAGDASARMQLVQTANMIGDNTRSTLTAIAGMQDRDESRELREEQLRSIREGKKLKDEEEARLNARLKVISDSKGMIEPMTMKRLSTLTDKKSQEEWLLAATSGQFGTDLESSLRFFLGNGSNKQAIQATGGASLWDTAERLANQGAQYAVSADRAHMKANPTGKKLNIDQARTEGYDLYKNELLSSMKSPVDPQDLSSSKWDGVYNPYKANFLGFNSAIDTLPKYAKLKNNEIKTAVDKLATSGVRINDNLTADQQQQIIGSVIEKVKTRQIDPKKAAADISAYFAASSSYNRETNKYDLLGLQPQTAYMFTLNGTWPTRSRDKVNLMNPVDVENKIMNAVKFGTPPSLFTDTYGDLVGAKE